MYHPERKDSLELQSRKLESSHDMTCAEEFIQYYYDKLDKQQYKKIFQLYVPDALQVWNGISNTGAENIENFLSQLPHSTHNVLSLDMQRLPDNTPDKRTFLIKTAGTVKFKDYINKQFFQTFFTTSVGGKYNISIDNYRCLDGTP